MGMILTGHSSLDLNLVPFTCLADRFAYSDGKVSRQHGVAVLGDLDEVIFNLVFCVASLARYSMDASISQLVAECYPPERRVFKPSFSDE